MAPSARPMASPSQNLTPPSYHAGAAPLTASTALATWCLATATFFLIGTSLGGGLGASVVAQILALALVPIAVMRLHGVTHLNGVTHLLGLGRPPWRAIAGAALAGAGTWYVSLRLAVPILDATGRTEQARDISRAVTGDGAALPWVLLASALVPATCEEILHRGMLLPALAARAGRVAALAAVTVLFAVMHIEPARMAAAACIGLAAGILALRTRSLWPAITLHLVNNVCALVVGTEQVPGVTRPIAGHPDATLAITLACTAAGLALGVTHKIPPNTGQP